MGFLVNSETGHSEAEIVSDFLIKVSLFRPITIWAQGASAGDPLFLSSLFTDCRKVGGTNPKRQTNPKCLNARLIDSLCRALRRVEQLIEVT